MIRGLKMAAMTMKKGEKAKLHVSAKYAYGANGYKDKNIPPNAELLYEVEMLLIENVNIFTHLSMLLIYFTFI